MRASCVGRSTLAFTASLCFIWNVISQLRYSSNALPSSDREALSNRFSDPFTHWMYSDFEGPAIVVLLGSEAFLLSEAGKETAHCARSSRSPCIILKYCPTDIRHRSAPC